MYHNMYLKLQLQYYALPEISDGTAKLDMWARLYSQTVNTNLCPYFEWWGWTLTAETKDACSKLPAWKLDALSRFAGKTFIILSLSLSSLFPIHPLSLPLTAETKDACSKLPAWKLDALNRFAGKTYLTILCKSKNI